MFFLFHLFLCRILCRIFCRGLRVGDCVSLSSFLFTHDMFVSFVKTLRHIICCGLQTRSYRRCPELIRIRFTAFILDLAAGTHKRGRGDTTSGSPPTCRANSLLPVCVCAVFIMEGHLREEGGRFIASTLWTLSFKKPKVEFQSCWLFMRALLLLTTGGRCYLTTEMKMKIR